ncbi:FliO/MopB family protein [Bdellovibrio sp. HCB2-146]|uniref:FliO/MopB family protein n=1 Tax=Bdellovibrio sp. HCB2-146 TaxID=3394362 RepID=UPI0039BCC844
MRWLLSLVLIVSVCVAQANENAAPPAAEAAVASTEAAVAPEVAAAEAATSASTIKTDNRKESEIPLNLESKKNAAAEGSGLFRIMMTLSILGVVGTGAFIFLRKYSIPKGSKHQTQIKVLQQHYLGPKKSLAIVRVAGESILIGVTDHNINMIKSLSLLDDEVPEEAPGNFTKVLGSKGVSFSDIEEDQEEETPAPRKRAKDLDPDEEFAISGIKDIVSKRLKGMRSFQ